MNSFAINKVVIIRIPILFFVGLLVVGCATHEVNKVQSYDEMIMSRPLPDSEMGRMNECKWIKAEAHRIQGGFQLAATLDPNSSKRREILFSVQKSLEILRSRSNKVGCTM